MFLFWERKEKEKEKARREKERELERKGNRREKKHTNKPLYKRCGRRGFVFWGKAKWRSPMEERAGNGVAGGPYWSRAALKSTPFGFVFVLSCHVSCGLKPCEAFNPGALQET